MTELLEWLLCLENIRLGRDAPLLVKWGVDLPAWVLFGCTLAGAVWITLVYRRERAYLLSCQGAAASVMRRSFCARGEPCPGVAARLIGVRSLLR